MKVLLDTNILIPLEPTSAADVKPETATLAELSRRAQLAKAELFFHPAIHEDLARDRNEERRAVRQVLLQKYRALPSPPTATSELEAVLGPAERGSNNWVDSQLVVALARDAVDLIVSDDADVRRKARRLKLDDAVLTSNEALPFFRRLYDEAPTPPTGLQRGVAHDLDENDSFFASFAVDYGAVFWPWLKKAKKEHRVCWYSKTPDHRLEALCLVKPEDKDPPPEAKGRVLKICTLKVSDEARGIGLGEQLLKAAFTFSYENRYDSLFVTLFEQKQPELVDLLVDLGFARSVVERGNGEAQYCKRLHDDATALRGLELNIALGPRCVDFQRTVAAVPIQPRFVDMLFPDATPQLPLLQPRAKYSNAIRKAYLCNANIRTLTAGDVLLFYRSETSPGFVAVGVVEDTLVSGTVGRILQFAGKRTVYPRAEIEKLTSKGEVLAVRFREARVLSRAIQLDEFTSRGMLASHPQSISQLKLQEGHAAWIDQRTLE